ncbi:MAG: DUF501 domain-containing protein [Actinobacteria bacterium]|nr:DUF501 domain-containing protein [Actinomycetota bacterium]MBU4302605.1 DUF501 domain-containing protein [Actinomycetota bacterium]MBU4385675.1 DUF501 domain-containing protein [Actinomycetota bacterium]MBU4489525.1 DUF501 domain-containing protein [Actinomycetota bacterium]MCG2794810.1 DUF501 domain-containing protein [Actinomycetes bacterium]
MALAGIATAGAAGLGERVVVAEDNTCGLDELPGLVRSEFTHLENAMPTDLRVIRRQLGRTPRGDVLVALRCPHGRPAVILTVPLGRPGRALPPIIWLSCPYAAREMGRLESEGAAKEFDCRLESDRELAGRYMEEDERFARVQDTLARSALGDGFADKLGRRGVAGGRRGTVKCLHAHLSYQLASGRGLVGQWCLERLRERAGNWCEEIPPACVD